MLSIIIPTLNEEKYLPLLLESIKRQDFKDYEIVIADAGSKDKTIEIAKKYGCKITKGGLPAEGKNRGAGAAKGEFLLFLDADTVLPPQFLKNAISEFQKRKLDIGSFRLLSYEDNKLFQLGLYLFYNFPIVLLEKILPHAATGILVKKKIFEKVKGFDTTVKLAEDHHLARRIKKIGGSCGIIRSAVLFTSDRRFREDGLLRTSLKYLFCELYMIFRGPVRSDIFEYKFDHYSSPRSKKDLFSLLLRKKKRSIIRYYKNNENSRSKNSSKI